ncbi:hypothetical protein ACFIJ5_16175 [Haloimpatiens sp. FM7330]|uniref:hypothetical protein n=1 Tax=Haloimpatiens sp. FM7330 TaxID=3298610 RepID=UPI003627675F
MKIGKIIKGTGRVVGTVLEYKIKLTGEVLGAVAEVANKPKAACTTRKVTKKAGKVLGDTTKVVTNVTGNIVDKAVDIGGKAAKKIGDNVVKENIIEIGENGEVRNLKYIKDVDYKVIDECD